MNDLPLPPEDEDGAAIVLIVLAFISLAAIVVGYWDEIVLLMNTPR